MGALAQSLRRMVEALKIKIEEAEAFSRDASQKTQEASVARENRRGGHPPAQTAKAQGMLDAANKLEGVVLIVNSASGSFPAQIEQSTRGSLEQSGPHRANRHGHGGNERHGLEVAKNASQAATTADTAKGKAQEGASIVKQVLQGIAEVQTQALDMKNDMSALGRQAKGSARS